MDLAERIIALVRVHPAIRSIELVGSRAMGGARPESDWDFRVETDDFARAAAALPNLLAPLEPLVQQWDRLSDEHCWMVILRGPTKVDLIFPEEPHEHEPPWEPRADNLDDLDAHFWDWMLWLRGKEAARKSDLVASELQKLFEHLLSPMGVERAPSSIAEAIERYRHARDRLENMLGRTVSRKLENEAASAFVA